MDSTFAGVLGVPFILALIQVAKGAGMDSKWAAPLSLFLGISLTVGFQFSLGAATRADWFNATIVGMAIGLSASGLYSGAKKTIVG